MNAKFLTVMALLAGATLSVSAALPGKSAPATKITADYVETRTAAVFAGACHYNGELVTTGRDAVLAWSFTGGSFNGVDLKGVRAAAGLTSEATLGDEHAARKTELVIDSSATAQQASALQSLLQAKCAEQLGQITSVRRAPVAFVHTASGFQVNAPGFAEMNISYRTDNACCIQPNLVWFSPLVTVEDRKVGFTENAVFTGTVTNHWQRQGDDSAFYGTATF